MAELATDWPLVGRRDETARLQSTLAARGGGGVVIAGPAGAGKTSLARWCLDQAEALGYDRQWVCGARTTAAIPLGAFVPAVPTLGSVRSADGLFQAAHQAFRVRAEAAPVVLAVDDAHLLDDISALLVHQLAVGGSALVVLTLRSGGSAPEPLVDLWKEAHVERMELPPLEAGDVEELLGRVLGGPVDMAFTHELWRASGGNPLFIRELFTGARDAHLVQERDRTWCLVGELPSSPRLVELVESRLAGLEVKARQALELLAVGEPLRLQHVEALIPLDLLAGLESASLLRLAPGEEGAGQELVELAHPLYGEALRASMPRLRVRHLCLTLAESLEAAEPMADDDLERVVRWRLSGGAAVPTDRLLRVARRALDHFDVDFARRCAEAAQQREPTVAGALILGEVLILANEHEAAEEMLAAAAAGTAGDEEIMACARARADNLFHWLDRPEQAREVLDAAEKRLTSDAAQRRLAVRRAWFDLFEGDPRAALDRVEDSLAHPEPPVRLAAVALATRAGILTGQFRRGLELAEQVAEAERVGARPRGVDPPLGTTAELFTLVQSGRLERAITLARGGHAEAIEAGAAPARGWFADMAASAYLLQGRPLTAERWYREALAALTRFGALPRAGVAKAGVAHCLALRGDGTGARACLAELQNLPGRHWLLETEIVQARAWAEVADDHVASARDTLLEAAGEQQRGGGHVFEAILLHDAVRLGALSPVVVGRLEALSGVVEGELMTARARHARALLAGDPDGLAEVAGVFEAMGAVLLAAEATAGAAGMAARKGADREATAWTRRARDLAARCEGSSTPGLRLPESAPAPVLSARELEIATLAAEGLSSKAIAERLFLSSRTVDNYLGRVFTKLGVTSRAQLAESMETVASDRGGS